MPGATVIITEIGTSTGTEPNQAGTALVCDTTNVNTQCCRGSDSGNGPVGFWYDPDGAQIPRGADAGPLYRTGSTEQVRLSRMSGSVMGPLGAYECRVPDSDGMEQVAVIYIQSSKLFFFGGGGHYYNSVTT